MYKWSKQEHEELHCGHGVLEDLPSASLFFVIGAALTRLHWRSLIFNLVNKSAAAATPAGALVCATEALTVAVLGGLQEHPVESVKEFGLSNTQLILVACMEDHATKLKKKNQSGSKAMDVNSGSEKILLCFLRRQHYQKTENHSSSQINGKNLSL